MKESRTFFSTTRIAMIALFGALAGILHVFSFSLPFAFPGFLEYDLSDIPLFIGTFAMGPVSGCIIVVIKLLVRLVCKGTGSVFVGELANFLIGVGFVIPAGLIYKHNRTFRGALLALAVGSLSSIAVAILTNWLILIPFYVYVMFEGNWELLLNMMRLLFPSITQETFYNYYLWVSVLPFNTMRCLIASILTLVVYKHISRLINRLGERLEPKAGKETAAKKRDLIVTVSCIAVVLLLVLFALLRYFLWS